MDKEAAQYFLDVTGAKAILAYDKPTPILSMLLDNLYFCLYQEYDNVVDLVEILFEQQHALARV